MITGGAKFFDEGQFVYGQTGVSIEASTGDIISHHALDKNPFTAWLSVSSTDLITETLTVLFPQTTLNRLMFRNINWKQFTVKYKLSGVWTDFTGVSGLDGALAGGISETTFADDTGYYEFDEVETTGIQIQILKTQVANAQKYCYQILGFMELGTLLGYPDISPDLLLNQRSKKMMSGKSLIIPGEESFELKMNFKGYPGSYSSDLDLMFELFRRRRPFYVWPCGGRRGSTYFRYQPETFRLRDVYLVQIDSKLSPGFKRNFYRGAIDLGNIVMRETGGFSAPGGTTVSEPTYNIDLTLANGLAATEFLVVDPADYYCVIMRYHLWRKTSSVNLTTSGKIVFQYIKGTNTWIANGPVKEDDGTDDGVTFPTVVTAGVLSVRRATTTLAGTGYEAGCKYSLEYFDAP